MKNSLIYCTDKSPQSFNPQISHDIATLDATTHQLYNRLIKIDPVSQRFIADLATHWQVNSDKTVFTFFLRKDVNFHHNDYFQPTRQLNADDVLFSFQRMLSLKHPFHSVNNEASNYLYNRTFSNLVSEIIKVDQHTVKFLLNKSDATFLANLAAHYAVIHSQEYALQLLQSGHPERIDFYPIGTGPYQFKQNSTKQIIRYQKHLFPWQTEANVNNLIFDVTANSSKRYAKLLSGECDIITNPAPSQVKQISQNPSVSLSSLPTSNVSFIAFNSKKKPLDEDAVRQALSNAIDLDTIRDAVFFKSAIATNTLLAEHSWAYNPRINVKPFSAQKSLSVLRGNKFDFHNKLRILTPLKDSTFNPNFYKTAQLIQSNWADIGIKSEIIQLRGTELASALMNGDYDIFLTGISPYIKDPDNLFRPLLSCNATQFEGNSSQWCDPHTQTLLDSTLLELNFIQRVKSYYQLQEYIQQKRVYLPIVHPLRFDVFNKNIKKLQVDPLTGINFSFVEKEITANKVDSQ